MPDLPPKDTKPEPLDYQDPKSRPAGHGVGCFVSSILLACAVGGLAALAFVFMVGSRTDLATILAVGTLVLIVGAIVARKYGMSAALAILLASLGVFVLMSGVCSQFTVRLGH